ncbi:hypothetical protein TD95_001222 [Thielaviopsis punctulata]|uniref:Carrier domain-containing protein n=1 Tax=Thielaviopsis punctulata TaxID=72032 RepID=A0A0F4ZDK3_9PEZI|nr:hypothetical protein TD95_001222 [Thielaviopsis punctulata]
MPNPESQEANIREVYSQAGINYNDTAYVECHGTGTLVGDKFETLAISNAIQSPRSICRPVIIGSVKTNIGHLEAAAGVASFIKAVLTVEKGKILPNINFSSPRTDFSVSSLGLEVPFEVMDWPQGYTKRQVSINSFGFGGTNAHIVLQDAVDLSLPLTPPLDSSPYPPPMSPQPFVFSARDTASLKRMLVQMAEHLESLPTPSSESYFENLSYTILLSAKETDFVTLSSSAPRICFIFAGQGGVWPQMGENLRSFKVYRDSIASSNEYFKSMYQWKGDIETLLSAPKSEIQIQDVHLSQILSTTVQIACIDLLASLDITADYVVGHSSGEIAAAYAARKITKRFALSCAFLRGLSTKSLLKMNSEVNGGMVSVGMSEAEAEAFLDKLQLSRRNIVVACINSPRSVTIAGRSSEISVVVAELDRLSIFHRVLNIPLGYHSPDMTKIESFYSNSLLSSVQSRGFFSAREVAEAPTMFSSLFACEMDKTPLDTTYWPRNLVEPVQFKAALEAMMKNGNPQPSVFIEVGTGGGMRAPVLDTVTPHAISRKKPVYISLLNHKQSSEASIVQRLGEMWTLGLPINLTNVISRSTFPGSLRCLNDLPSYPWNHEHKYWHESKVSSAFLSRSAPRRDLIGSRSLESTPYEMKWRGFHRLSENPWIRDHKVQGTLLYPAAGMIAMVVEAGAEISSEMQNVTAYEITDFAIHHAMVVPDDNHGLESTLSMKRTQHSDATTWDFSIYSCDTHGTTQRNASGTLTLISSSESMDQFLCQQSSRILEYFAACTEEASTIELYEALESIGLCYGSTFRNITNIRRNGTQTFATLKVPDTKSGMPYGFEFEHVIHPATLDSMLHTLFTPESQPMVPVGVEKIVISASLRGGSAGTPFYGFGNITSQGVRETHGDLAMTLNLTENPQVVLSGIRLAALQLPQGWLRNHRYLATEVVWREDISKFRPASGWTFEQLLQSLAFKKPVLTVLKIGWSAAQSPRLLELFARPGMNIMLTVQKHMFCDIDEESLKKSGLPYKIIDMFGKEIASSYDLIFACSQDGLNIASLQGRLPSHGVMILPSPLKYMIPYISSDHAKVDLTNAISRPKFGNGNS